jgi:hypothetical protein
MLRMFEYYFAFVIATDWIRTKIGAFEASVNAECKIESRTG